MTAPAAETSLWGALTDALAEMEALVLDDPRIDDDVVRAEGVRYLTRLLAGGIPMTMECADPDYPQLVQFLSSKIQFGLPAADCRYHWAAVRGGETVAVWGCGPVGQFSIRSAFLQGAERVIAIDHVPERLAMAKAAGAEVVNFDEAKVHDELMERTRGHGPHAVIDAVGMEAHEGRFIGMYDKVKQLMRMETDRPFAFRQAVQAYCREVREGTFPGPEHSFK